MVESFVKLWLKFERYTTTMADMYMIAKGQCFVLINTVIDVTCKFQPVG